MHCSGTFRCPRILASFWICAPNLSKYVSQGFNCDPNACKYSSHAFQMRVPKASKCVPNASKCVQMHPTASKWVPNASKCFRMRCKCLLQMRPKVSKLWNASKCLPNASKYVPNSSRCVPIASKTISKCVPNGNTVRSNETKLMRIREPKMTIEGPMGMFLWN